MTIGTGIAVAVGIVCVTVLVCQLPGVFVFLVLAVFLVILGAIVP